MKKAAVSICIVLVLLSCALLLFACDDAPSQQEIAAQCIRIHIRANSNSETDQAVKLKVRDEVTEYLTSKLDGCKSKNEARNTLDLTAVPVMKQLTHLPLVVDPSHATGRAVLVPAMAKAAVAAGADGVMIEVHNDPQSALCDGEQSMTPERFDSLCRSLQAVHDCI